MKLLKKSIDKNKTKIFIMDAFKIVIINGISNRIIKRFGGRGACNSGSVFLILV